MRNGPPWVVELCVKFLAGASGWFISSKMDLGLAIAWPSLPVCSPLLLPPGPARAPLRSALGPPGVPAPRALGFHKSMPFSFSWGSLSVSCLPFSGKHSPPGTGSCASLGVWQLSTYWGAVASVSLTSRSHVNVGFRVPGTQQIQDRDKQTLKVTYLLCLTFRANVCLRGKGPTFLSARGV